MSMIFNILRVTGGELESYLNDSSLLLQRMGSLEAGDARHVDIDHSWEGIIFLLTGQRVEELDHPLGKAFFSNQQIDKDQDVGYGPAQYLLPEQVKLLNEKLSAITTDAFRGMFDSKRLTEAGIFPNMWEQNFAPDYLSEYFESVQEAFAIAARNDEAIITFLN